MSESIAREGGDEVSKEYEALWAKAHAAGMAAGEAKTPQPMTVYEADGLTDRPKPGGKSWYVPEGLCGFAWVKFAGNTGFGRWAKRTGLASKAYPKGLSVWVRQFGQSYERKLAYAQAAAEVLREGGVEAYAGGRLD